MTNNTTNTQIVNFHGAALLTVLHKDEPYVAMKPVCEAIGLDWRSQRQRIMRHEVLKSTVVMMTTVGSTNKTRDALFLPASMLNGWLFGIDIKRCKEAIRHKLITYQRECFKVLHDYWTKGEAVNPRFSTKDDRTPLKDAVNMLIGKSTNLSYSDAWRMVHQRFAINSVKELTVEQLPMVVEYVHKVILEGKLMDDIPQFSTPVISTIDPLGMEDLPPGRYLVARIDGKTIVQRLEQHAIVPLDHVSAFRRDMNQFMQYGAELMSRMRILHGETNLERLAKPLIG